MKEFIEKLIARLKEKKSEHLHDEKVMQELGKNNLASFCSAKARALDGAIEIFNELAEEYNGGWISVKDRLPEVAGWVLTCDKEGNIHIFFYANGYFCESFGYRKITEKHERFYVPIAWQPLPEPYKE